MKKKKVAYVLHELSLGGVEVALISAVPHLNRKFDLRIVCLGSLDPILISHFTSAEKAVFVSFPYSPLRFVFTCVSVIGFILRFNPDLLICSLWRASLIGVIIKRIRKQIKLFAFIHNTAFFHIPDRIFTTLAIKYADEILTDSKATSTFVRSNFGNTARIKIVSFLTHRSPIQKINRPLDPVDSVKFMYLGRMHPIKNIPLAIDTIHFLHTRNIQATLDIYGSTSPYLEGIIKYIEDKNMKSFIQFQGELTPIQKLAIFGRYNFLIQLSQAEGMAMSVAEAMQNGVVCVVTPVGEIPNYSVDMESAIFMNHQTTDDWEESLKKLERVIRSPKMYDSISTNCWKNFQGVKTYSESLIECIRDI